MNPLARMTLYSKVARAILDEKPKQKGGFMQNRRSIIKWVINHQHNWYRREYSRIANICIWLLIPLAGALIASPVLGDLFVMAILGLIVSNFAVVFVLSWVDGHEKKLASQ